MVKKRGLGKSLDALLAYTESQNVLETDLQTEEKFTELATKLIRRGKYQPRREMDPKALEELASSIRQQGIIQPLIVRPLSDKTSMQKYEIIAGERRFQAAILAGLQNVPVIIRSIPDEAALAMALIENIQREDLNPIEEAIAIERLIKEFGMTHQQIADTLGKSRTTITNLLRLLSLPDQVKHKLEKGMLEMGHARTLITLDHSSQIEVAELIIARSLSVRETENLVRRLQTPATNISKKELDPDLMRLQENLSQQLKLPVAIQCNAKGKGKLVIHYRNLAELDDLITQFS